MKVRPLADRVLVRPLEEGETRRGSIYIPDTAKEKPQQGEVIEVGSGKVTDDGKVIPLDVKKGDRVLYAKWSGADSIMLGEVEHLILKASDIIATIEK